MPLLKMKATSPTTARTNPLTGPIDTPSASVSRNPCSGTPQLGVPPYRGRVTSVLIIENDRDSGPGRLLDWLGARSISPVVVRAWDGEPVPGSVDGHAGLILLGGGMLPDEDERSPWLPAERALLRQAHGQVPVLGICLGAQLLAHTFGGEVQGKYGQPEKGVTSLTVLPAAADDVLLAGLPSTVRAVESHQDQITRLPSDAVLLMSSERCTNQMLRLGHQSWGVQFHPEVEAERVRRWSPDRLQALGFDRDTVVADAERYAVELEKTWSTVVGRFLSLVG
ncbi:type 1 glutamine amidotransferase [Kribbella speibonae]|uniref:Type 1 glutamine amidotransferase n=1 Tax=Kribbella speibonae TaxID=1572660 RepID=A0A4V2M501_9ACTN|nr:type 1 glutamine amidotransferase [Kribbella speibonae]